LMMGDTILRRDNKTAHDGDLGQPEVRTARHFLGILTRRSCGLPLGRTVTDGRSDAEV
jgi:hypothetical protein